MLSEDLPAARELRAAVLIANILVVPLAFSLALPDSGIAHVPREPATGQRDNLPAAPAIEAPIASTSDFPTQASQDERGHRASSTRQDRCSKGEALRHS